MLSSINLNNSKLSHSYWIFNIREMIIFNSFGENILNTSKYKVQHGKYKKYNKMI